MKPQFISPVVHGILDYVTAATLPFCPRMLGFRESTTHLIDAVAGTIAANQMLTRNAAGLVKVMPMKAHLTLDYLTGGMLLATAAMMDEDEPTERAVVAGIAVHLLTQAALTRTTPSGTSSTTPSGAPPDAALRTTAPSRRRNRRRKNAPTCDVDSGNVIAAAPT